MAIGARGIFGSVAIVARSKKRITLLKAIALDLKMKYLTKTRWADAAPMTKAAYLKNRWGSISDPYALDYETPGYWVEMLNEMHPSSSWLTQLSFESRYRLARSLGFGDAFNALTQANLPIARAHWPKSDYLDLHEGRLIKVRKKIVVPFHPLDEDIMATDWLVLHVEDED